MSATRRWAAVLAAAVLSAGMVACSSGARPDAAGGDEREGVTADEIDYGLVYDQTGPTASAQQPWANGFITQITKANDAGGVNGRQINLVQIDDRYEVPTGVSAYRRLVDQTPVVGITGLNNSAIQEAAMEQVRRDGMPIVGPQATARSGLVPFNPTAFYVTPSYADQADIMLGYMQDRLAVPAPKVAVIRIVTSSGVEFGDLVRSRVEAAGGSIVADQELPPTSTSADAQVQNALAANPDFIAYHGSPTLSVLLLRSMQKFGGTTPIISTFGGGGPVAFQSGIDQATADLFQFVSAFVPSDVDTPGTAEMVADAQRYGFAEDAANSQFVIGYVTGKVVVEALTGAGQDLTREGFVAALEALEGLDTGGISQPVGYGPDNRAGLSASVPFRYDFAAGRFEAVGTFADYERYVTGEYRNG